MEPITATQAAITDSSWYDTRMKGLSNGISALHDEYKSQIPAAPPVGETADEAQARHAKRLVTIVALLDGLEKFGQAHYQFFRDGLFPKDDQSITYLQESSQLPPPRVLERILDQIGSDLDVISRAANQRAKQGSSFSAALTRADKLAYRALQRAVDKQGLLDSANATDWTVLTYLQKSPSVRVIPYANVALVGVPFTTIAEERDFLAIPHEIGHIVYRRRERALDDPMDRSLFAHLPKFAYKHWGEEMFADVYGALVGGPVIALDFQELSLEYASSQFLDTTDSHPVPILRPFIYTKVLKAIGMDQDAARLHQRWINTLNTRMTLIKQRVGLTTAQEDLWKFAQQETTDLQSGRGMDDGILEILDVLSTVAKNNWSGPSAASDLDTYKNYKLQIDSLIGNITTAQLEIPMTVSSQVWENVMTAEGVFGGSGLSKWLAANSPVKSGDLSSLSQKPDNNWVQIWLATGWASEGPVAEPKQP